MPIYTRNEVYIRNFTDKKNIICFIATIIIQKVQQFQQQKYKITIITSVRTYILNIGGYDV